MGGDGHLRGWEGGVGGRQASRARVFHRELPMRPENLGA